MKKVTLIVRQPEINKAFPNGFQLLLGDNGFQLLLGDNASTLDAIRIADEEIKKKAKTFQ